MSERFGIKISNENKDVFTAETEDLVFSSEFPTITIRQRLSLSVSTTGGGSDLTTSTGSNSFDHNFGYIPQVLCFVTTGNWTSSPNSYINVPNTFITNNVSGGSVGYLLAAEYFDCYTTDTTVTVSAISEAWDGSDGTEGVDTTYNFDILLLMEEALTS
jgi:hypothetical protein